MLCNYINLVEETPNHIDDNLSQVPATPLMGATENEVAFALKFMANQMEDDLFNGNTAPDSPQQSTLLQPMSFMEILQRGRCQQDDQLQDAHCNGEAASHRSSQEQCVQQQGLDQNEEYINLEIFTVPHTLHNSEQARIIDLLRVPVTEASIRRVP
ncbi:hypothetical protein GOP47_0012880 [Adiantum capillus-veneris]|uniref:Uncharacterized protein n=1 Tax=Adiantum capillus-veneris TaxID=13818 RepID=A0A9D4ZET8_ADICA|nr:hypothetical protein GOP47_0012880 [Adiantum capillus-veneris]